MRNNIKEEVFRTSLSLPVKYNKALELVWNLERVSKTRQIELALRIYMEKYKEILAKNGINLWDDKFLGN